MTGNKTLTNYSVTKDGSNEPYHIELDHDLIADAISLGLSEANSTNLSYPQLQRLMDYLGDNPEVDPNEIFEMQRYQQTAFFEMNLSLEQSSTLTLDQYEDRRDASTAANLATFSDDEEALNMLANHEIEEEELDANEKPSTDITSPIISKKRDRDSGDNSQDGKNRRVF